MNFGPNSPSSILKILFMGNTHIDTHTHTHTHTHVCYCRDVLTTFARQLIIIQFQMNINTCHLCIHSKEGRVLYIIRDSIQNITKIYIKTQLLTPSIQQTFTDSQSRIHLLSLRLFISKILPSHTLKCYEQRR